jgi:hypothetical protein
MTQKFFTGIRNGILLSIPLWMLIIWAAKAFAGEHGGIDPWMDANQAAFKEPVILVWQDCPKPKDKGAPDAEENPLAMLFGGGEPQCTLHSKYIFAPSVTGGKAVVCFRPTHERLTQCLYKEDKTDATEIFTILAQGEHI